MHVHWGQREVSVQLGAKDGSAPYALGPPTSALGAAPASRCVSLSVESPRSGDSVLGV